MATINSKKVSYGDIAEDNKKMAVIRSQAGGDAAVALLDDYDRTLLLSALNAYSKENKIGVTQIAEDIGVGRIYLYNLIGSEQIELNRLSKIQDYLGINIISESAVDRYLQSLKIKLTNRKPDFKWNEKCIYLNVPRYYLMEYLLPGIERCVNNWDFYESNSADYDKNTFGSNISPQNMIFNKLIEYCENNIEGGDWAEIVDTFTMTFKDKYFLIPIDPCSSYWNDLYEEIPDDIFESYERQQIDASAVTDNAEDAKEIKENLLKEKDKLNEYHEIFFNNVFDQAEKVEKWSKSIKKYCSKNNRILKKLPQYPLEIEEVANNLEENTIPVKEKKTKTK